MTYVLCAQPTATFPDLRAAEVIMTNLLNGFPQEGCWLAKDGDPEYNPITPEGYPYTLRWTPDGKLIAEPA